MAQTMVRGTQVLDHTIQRDDLDITTVGNSVIAKVIQGAGVSLSATGADAGTGDVTITATPSQGFIAKSAAYTIVAGDLGRYFICSGGSWTLTLPAATLGFSFWVRNDQGITGTTGTITLSPPSGTIDGAATLALLPGQQCMAACDGTNWRTFGLERVVVLGTQDISTSTANGTVLLPIGYRLFELEFTNLQPDSDVNNFNVLLSTNGGSSWVAAGYYFQYTVNSTLSALVTSGANSTTNWFIGPSGSTAGNYNQCRLVLKPAQYPTFVSEASNYVTSTGIVQRWTNGGLCTGTGAGTVNALQYSFTTGNIANSSLTVKGIV